MSSDIPRKKYAHSVFASPAIFQKQILGRCVASRLEKSERVTHVTGNTATPTPVVGRSLTSQVGLGALGNSYSRLRKPSA